MMKNSPSWLAEYLKLLFSVDALRKMKNVNITGRHGIIMCTKKSSVFYSYTLTTSLLSYTVINTKNAQKMPREEDAAPPHINIYCT